MPEVTVPTTVPAPCKGYTDPTVFTVSGPTEAPPDVLIPAVVAPFTWHVTDAPDPAPVEVREGGRGRLIK